MGKCARDSTVKQIPTGSEGKTSMTSKEFEMSIKNYFDSIFKNYAYVCLGEGE